MNPTDLERRLLDYLDGTASPAERDRTESWLESNPEARARHNELKALFAEVASLPPADPPADLRERVLAEIRVAGRRAPAPHTAAVAARGPARTFGLRPGLAMGAAFAAGLLAGVLAIEGWRGGTAFGPSHPADVTGSMGSAAPVTGEPAVAELGSARIGGRARDEGESSLAEIEIGIPEGITAELVAPSHGRAPISVRRQGPSTGEVRILADRIVWSGPASGRFQVEFAAGPALSGPLTMILRSPTESSSVELPVAPRTRR